MAVEARHMNIFPPQLITNRDFIKTNQGMGNVYNTQMDSCVQSLVCDPNISAKTSFNKAKRYRDSFTNGFDSYSVPPNNKLSGVSSVLHNHVFSHIQQQHQQDIDLFISDHAEKVRLEVEERRKRQSRVLVTALQEGVTKKLKEKDQEIQRIGKLNWVLQERVKSLFVENQLWRDLAQTNEAAANSLRTNLEQVLAHVGEERHVSGGGAAESSCGSSEEGWRKVVPPKGSGDGGRKCRKCGERESSVLLLPCRHLCVCTMCGSTMVGTCPVCLSVTNATVHVNMSS
ncbi:BOI-related gene 1 [Hibiscus trionum]|uniref:BOI-related gene 1 n=1 Tax=Hibiscus trionum TaxID=183268 RepID=A0A9W7IKA0_HIBTR|nr:BOI-related gene 1 [Hibiscus trionum]